MYFLLKMGIFIIFHCYVSLPEGKCASLFFNSGMSLGVLGLEIRCREGWSTEVIPSIEGSVFFCPKEELEQKSQKTKIGRPRSHHKKIPDKLTAEATSDPDFLFHLRSWGVRYRGVL